jgi:cytochrome c oxidase subunit 2
MPVEASADAALVDNLFDTMMIVGTGIFLLVEGILVICAFKFRRREGDTTDGPPIAGNIPLEILWTAIPVVIVLVIGVYSFEIYRIEGGFDPEAADQTAVQVAMAPNAEAVPLVPAMPAHHQHLALGVGATPDRLTTPPDVTVNVLGLQYAWIFTYPDSGITAGELHVPAGKDVKLVIKAQDVLHAFWLPQFRLKQDAIPGQDAELRFTPNRVGEYPIVCAELCGPYHGAMGSKLYVQEPDEYDQWVQSQVASKVDQSDGQTVAVTPTTQSDADYLATIHKSDLIDSSALESLQYQMHKDTPEPSPEQALTTLQPAA